MLKVKWRLGLSGGAVIANPIPARYEMPPAAINAAIDEALALAESNGIHGPELTPFLLDRVKTITGGDSLESNIALVKNNARLASEIALVM
jgi:pseudouridine-5'-phosphate glycosidase